MLFLKFFKWLYNPNEPDPKKRETPDCMKGIKQLPRKEISAYKPDDMRTNQEHAIFLKYCPNLRDRCYHAMAFNTSCRPSELLSRKISDIKFKVSPEGIQYAEITVNGKTGRRTLLLIESIPYVKEWIQSHPTGTNPIFIVFMYCISELQNCVKISSHTSEPILYGECISLYFVIIGEKGEMSNASKT